MPNEDLTRFEEVVDGTYQLGAVIKRSTRSTVYETEFGPEALPAVIKICESEFVDAEKLSEQWRSATQLSHPNMLRLYAAGTTVLNGTPIVYAVMERAEQTLEEVLEGRALTGDETREILRPTLAALEYLHKEGYTHSGLRASNVLAVGEELKLSSDGVVRTDDPILRAEEVKALGTLIVQALTQEVPNRDGVLDSSIAQ